MFPFEIIFLTKTKFFLFNSWNSYWFFSLWRHAIVSHECNGIDIITALILNDISPLCRYRMELVLQLKVRIQSWHKHRGCTLIINKSCSSLFSLYVIIVRTMPLSSCSLWWRVVMTVRMQRGSCLTFDPGNWSVLRCLVYYVYEV